MGKEKYESCLKSSVGQVTKFWPNGSDPIFIYFSCKFYVLCTEIVLFAATHGFGYILCLNTRKTYDERKKKVDSKMSVS